MIKFRLNFKKVICLFIAITMISSCSCAVLAVKAEEAYIVSPSDGDWLDTTQKITIRAVKPDSKSTLKITIKNDVTGTFIAQNEEFSGTSYTLNPDVLSEKQRYKIWVGTFQNGTSIGQGDVIYVNTNNVNYKPAYFTSPQNGGTVSADSDLKISWNQNSKLAYWLSINDETIGKKIVDEKEIHSGYYVISKNLLTAGHKYKAWIGTYVSSSIERKLLGDGDTIYFSTNKASSDGADFSFPKEGDVLDPSVNITLKFKNCNPNLVHKIAIRDVDEDRTVIYNQPFSGNSFVIKANTLDYGKNYKLWIGTYLDQNAENSMDAGHIIYIWTEDETEPEDINKSTDEFDDEFEEDDEEDEQNIGISDEEDDYEYEYEDEDDSTVEDDTDENELTDTTDIFDQDTYPTDEIYYDVPTNHKNYDAIISMSHKGILNGYGNGSFRPDAYVTRAEFTKIMDSAGLLDNRSYREMPSFTDTRSHWAASYISKAYMVGAIDGFDKYSFMPDNNITFQEAAKILSVLVGADEDYIKQRGGWPYGYIWFAYDNDIGANTSFEVFSSGGKSYEFVGNKISRADAAQMVYNCINNNNEFESNDFVSILEDMANEQIGNNYETYVKNPFNGTDNKGCVSWCVYFATWLADRAMLQCGIDKKDASTIVPWVGSTAGLIKYYNREKYHNFTKYTSLVTGISYSPNCFSDKDYMPKAGDLVFIETGSKIEVKDNNGGKIKVDNAGPDHTGIIISVDEKNKTFICIEGNTGSGTTGTRKVRWVDYKYYDDINKWARTNDYGGKSNYVHGFISPDYPI